MYAGTWEISFQVSMHFRGLCVCAKWRHIHKAPYKTRGTTCLAIVHVHIYRHEHDSNVIIPTCSSIRSCAVSLLRWGILELFIHLGRISGDFYRSSHTHTLSLSVYVFVIAQVCGLWTFKLSFAMTTKTTTPATTPTNYQLECEMPENSVEFLWWKPHSHTIV